MGPQPDLPVSRDRQQPGLAHARDRAAGHDEDQQAAHCDARGPGVSPDVLPAAADAGRPFPGSRAVRNSVRPAADLRCREQHTPSAQVGHQQLGRGLPHRRDDGAQLQAWSGRPTHPLRSQHRPLRRTAAQPVGRPTGRHQRAHVLPGRRHQHRVPRADQHQHRVGRPVRLGHRRHRPDHPTRHRAAARTEGRLRRQRRGVPGPVRRIALRRRAVLRRAGQRGRDDHPAAGFPGRRPGPLRHRRPVAGGLRQRLEHRAQRSQRRQRAARLVGRFRPRWQPRPDQWHLSGGRHDRPDAGHRDDRDGQQHGRHGELVRGHRRPVGHGIPDRPQWLRHRHGR